MAKNRTTALRWASPRAAVLNWLGHLTISLAAITGAYLDGIRDRPALPSASLAIAWVVFGPIAFAGLVRILLDGGIVPRIWVRREGDEFVVWSVWSLLWRGRRVHASADKPAELVIRTSSMLVLPGSMAGGWLVFRDEATRFFVTVYAPDVPGALEALAAKVIGTGLPVKDIVREVQ